mgnify:CR=1 FL=1
MIVNIIILFNFFSQSLEINDLTKAYAFLQKRHIDSANYYFTAAINNNPNNTTLYIERGKTFIKLNQIDRAIKDFNKANSIKNNIASYYLAYSYALIKDTINTIKYTKDNLSSSYKAKKIEYQLETAFLFLKNNPEWNKIWEKEWYSTNENLIGELRFNANIKDWNSIIKTIQNLEINKKKLSHEMNYYASLAYFNLKNYKTATFYIDKAIRINKNPQYYELRAKCKAAQNDFRGCDDDLNYALKENPYDFSLYIEHAKTLCKLHRYEESSNVLSNYIVLFPEDTSAMFLYSEVSFYNENYITTLEILNKLISINTKDIYLLLRARTYSKLKLNNNALKDYDSISNKNPNNAQILVERALLKIEMGDKKNACIDLLKAEQLGSVDAANLRWQNCSMP